MAGGKLTTYRLMAQQAVDRIIRWLGKSSRTAGGNGVFAECRTAQEPLLPAAEVAGVSGILPPELNRRAVEHYVANEWSVHLDDVMLRRTSWHYYSTEAPRLAERVADWMGELLGWSPQTRAAELERYTRLTAVEKAESLPQNHS